ncbi:MAG: YIP1 family protein [Chloroflexi bacterium]|nr:YIP1 family protein [Chloroflexota bacterium]
MDLAAPATQSIATQPSGSLIGLVLRAARLDGTAYDEIKRDPYGTAHSFSVVLLSVTLYFVSLLSSLIVLTPDAGPGLKSSILMTVFFVLFVVGGWVIWSYIAYWVGTMLLGGTAPFEILLRTLGLTFGPWVLAFVLIPLGLVNLSGSLLGIIFGVVGPLWSLLSALVAIRHAFDFHWKQAFVTTTLAHIPVVGFAIIMFAA